MEAWDESSNVLMTFSAGCRVFHCQEIDSAVLLSALLREPRCSTQLLCDHVLCKTEKRSLLVLVLLAVTSGIEHDLTTPW